MEELAPGTALDATGMQVPGARHGAPLEIIERLGELPYGDTYRARIDAIPVLATHIDPALVGDLRTIEWIGESLTRAASIEHRNLAAIHGIAGKSRTAPSPDDPCVVVQSHCDGRQARQWIADRAARGRTVELETARTVIGHLCNALQVLHGVMVHGYVGVDTVWLSTTGRVLLSDAGLGPLVPRSRRFARMHAAGRLPSVAPEQMGPGGNVGPGTDVFGLATLFIELVTGRPLPEAGAPLATVGLHGPADLLLCLERATAPEPNARPPDAVTFKTELAEALAREARLELGAPTAPARSGPPRAATPPVVNVRRAPAPTPTPTPTPTLTSPRPSAPLVLPPLSSGRRDVTPPPASSSPSSRPGTPTTIFPAAPLPSERPRTPVVSPPVKMPPVGPSHAPTAAPPLAGGTVAVPAGPPATAAMPMPMPMPMPGAPGAPVSVMLPNGMPAMGVVGAPVPGPGGYPAYVPVFVSVPAPAPGTAPTPARQRPPAGDLGGLDALDRATRRIADAGAAEAVLELTEDVADRNMRAAEPSPPASASTSGGMSASISASGVRVDLGFEEAARGRTPTESGPEGREDRSIGSRTRPDHRTPPPVSATPTSPARTPTDHRTPRPVSTPPPPPHARTPPSRGRTPVPVSTTPTTHGRTPTTHGRAPSRHATTPTDHRPPEEIATMPASEGVRRVGIAIEDDEAEAASTAKYVWRRAGAPAVEHTLAELAAMARAGRLAPDDVLVQPITGRQMLVADVPALRDALRERGPAVPVGPRPAGPVVVPPMMLTSPRRTHPLVWIALAILLLGSVGALLWLRQQA